MLTAEDVTSEQIEDTMAMLNDMGINVVEDEEGERNAVDSNFFRSPLLLLFRAR